MAQALVSQLWAGWGQLRSFWQSRPKKAGTIVLKPSKVSQMGPQKPELSCMVRQQLCQAITQAGLFGNVKDKKPPQRSLLMSL